MKKIALLAIVAVSLLTLFSCEMDSGDEATGGITFYTARQSYNQFYAESGWYLDDGYFCWGFLDSVSWDDWAVRIGASTNSHWSVDNVYSWLKAHGFGNAEASQWSQWLYVEEEHPYIVVRVGSLVYLISK